MLCISARRFPGSRRIAPAATPARRRQYIRGYRRGGSVTAQRHRRQRAYPRRQRSGRACRLLLGQLMTRRSGRGADRRHGRIANAGAKPGLVHWRKPTLRGDAGGSCCAAGCGRRPRFTRPAVKRRGASFLRASGSGVNYPRVRVHIGALATASADAVNARAYTVGNQVVLGDNPATADPRTRTRPCRAVRGRAAAFAAAAGENGRWAARHEARPVRNSTRSRNGVRSGRRGVREIPVNPGLRHCLLAVRMQEAGHAENALPAQLACRYRERVQGPMLQGRDRQRERLLSSDRIAWANGRCCGAGEVVSPTSTAYRAPRRPSGRCPATDPRRSSARIFPSVRAAARARRARRADDAVRVLWTDQIHFEQDRAWRRRGGSVLTPEGAESSNRCCPGCASRPTFRYA